MMSTSKIGIRSPFFHSFDLHGAAVMVQPQSESHDTIIGRLIVEKGLATTDEVKDCEHMRKDLKGRSAERSMADILVTSGIVTSSQMARIWQVMEEREQIQEIPGYDLMEKLGEGAMATVYKAKQVSLDREVAIKILPKAKTRDPNFVKRFYDEGRVAGKLNHPNIVQAFDVGQAGDYHYFVMEYVPGITVFDHLNHVGKYSEPDAIRITHQIAIALKHAHAKGLIHRDVKPKNIMIAEDGTAKLADMGLARMVSDREAAEAEAGRAYGTPYYISPEQVRGEKDVDHRADLYSLGATLYLMLTGKVPFDAPTPSGVMLKHIREQMTPPDQVNAKLSSGICDIIEMLMTKNRDERYQTAVELIEDLEAVQRGDAPVYARRSVNLDDLSTLESTGKDVLPDSQNINFSLNHPLLEQPLFWATIASGLLNLFLLYMLFGRS